MKNVLKLVRCGLPQCDYGRRCIRVFPVRWHLHLLSDAGFSVIVNDEIFEFTDLHSVKFVVWCFRTISGHPIVGGLGQVRIPSELLANVSVILIWCNPQGCSYTDTNKVSI